MEENTPSNEVSGSDDSQAKVASAGIQLLASEVVDQIAAGEVVERPAHLVKELVENALDAGATSIEIEFDQGGRRVRVTDDGGGIATADLPLALARHATSKIVRADDLWRLHSFGFRGEALASIAAVSRLTLTSRQQGEARAHRLQCQFGRLGTVEAASGNPGTTILIEELFSNVPARLKFMKSEASESAQIKATLRALALAHEGVEFRIRTKGKIDSVWPKAGSFLERAKQVLGQESLYESALTYQDHSAEVVFASPGDVGGTARGIMTFVQKRWVQDKGLQAAVIDAYRGLLMHGEFPIACVRLQVPEGEVDVNIHPTKSQVKFRDSQPAFRAVNRALREGLERAPWLIKDASQGSNATTGASATPVKAGAAASVMAYAAATAASSTMPQSADARSAGGFSSNPKLGGGAGVQRKKLSVADLTRRYEPSEPREEPAGVEGARSEVTPSLATAPVNSVGRFEGPEFDTVVFRTRRDVEPPAESASPQASGAWSRLQVIGQADLTYIVAQDQNRLVLIDQHAAHERVAYERLMKAWLEGGADVQNLLIPLHVDLDSDGVEALLSISSELEKLGISLDRIGPSAVAVRAKPSLMSDTALVESLVVIAREICERGGSFVLEKKIGDLCATMACHSVVRAGQSLSVEQMRHLLKQMDEFPLSSFCPHGRPVSVDYPFAKLERDFGRIV